MTVSTTSTPITIAKEEAVGENLRSNLAQVLYIHYPINSGKKSVLALLDSGSKVNAIYLAFTKELGLPIRPTNIEVQKIDGTILEIYGIVVAAFLIKDKANQIRFFEEIFLVANVSLEVVFGMLFLILSSADVDFLGRELRWRTYTTKEAFLTTRHVELVDKEEFAATALDSKSEIFIVYVVSLSSDALPNFSPLKLDVYPFRRPQISGLIAKKAPTKVLVKYLDFANIFSPDLASKLPEYTGINYHTIELVNGQQPSYRPIYSLRSMELKTLKACIETN